MSILSELQNLVSVGAKEQDLQKVLKKDLSLLAKAYANSTDEYICFSELSIGTTGEVDFAVFTHRSFMYIYLIEVKGADFNLINNATKKGTVFNSKILEAIDQIIRRQSYATANEQVFNKEVPDLRLTIESGSQKYNSLLCNKGRLNVDRDKPVRVYGVVIGGRRNTMLQHVEDQKRKEWMNALKIDIKIESWDSFIDKIR